MESMEDADFPPENEPQYKFSSQTPLMGVIYTPWTRFRGQKDILRRSSAATVTFLGKYDFW